MSEIRLVLCQYCEDTGLCSCDGCAPKMTCCSNPGCLWNYTSDHCRHCVLGDEWPDMDSVERLRIANLERFHETGRRPDPPVPDPFPDDVVVTFPEVTR